MISTETTTKENDIYWLTSNDMINLPLVTKCVGVEIVKWLNIKQQYINNKI